MSKTVTYHTAKDGCRVRSEYTTNEVGFTCIPMRQRKPSQSDITGKAIIAALVVCVALFLAGPVFGIL